MSTPRSQRDLAGKSNHLAADREILRLESIRKQFPGVIALDDA